MDLNLFLPAAIVIISTWLFVLSVIVYWFVLRNKKERQLTVDDKLEDQIQSLVARISRTSQDLNILGERFSKIESESPSYIKKVGFVRFNPFAETGGDHSFSVAMLDGKDNGFIITSLHTRAGTRTYAKAVQSGKSETEFSNEEKKAISIAKKNETEE